jgi:anaerobic ribonucleoside-triphosphate reductase activating protein
MLLPVHNISHSRINGPGNRLVIWVQGCKFHCKGCFNPETHPYTKEHLMDINELAELINNDATIEGITLSGGEPLDYPKQLEELFEKINPRLTIVLYSGFNIEEINEEPSFKELLKMIDIAIVGRYDENLTHPFLGKKFVVMTNRIDLNYFRPKQVVEYCLNGNKVTKTGIFKNQ